MSAQCASDDTNGKAQGCFFTKVNYKMSDFLKPQGWELLKMSEIINILNIHIPMTNKQIHFLIRTCILSEMTKSCATD